MKKFLAASLCMFVVAACAMGGAKRSAMAPAPTAQSTGGEAPSMMSPKQDQIEALYAEVERERQEMQLPAPQDGGGNPGQPMTSPQPTTQNDATCKPAPSETCQTSCKLSDSICTNAEKICKLADDLQPDDSSAAKCTKATKTCKTSHEKCCGCML